MSKQKQQPTFKVNPGKKNVSDDTIVIKGTEDLDKIVKLANETLVTFFEGMLLEKGFTKKQISAVSEKMSALLLKVAKEEIGEEEAITQICRAIISDTIATGRLLTNEELDQIVNNGSLTFSEEELKTMGIGKNELKEIIATFITDKYADKGIIKEKVTNGLYKLIRDNWGSYDIDDKIRKELFMKGTESAAALQDPKIVEFYKAIETVTLKQILDYGKSSREVIVVAGKEEPKVDGATVRRVNPELNDNAEDGKNKGFRVEDSQEAVQESVLSGMAGRIRNVTGRTLLDRLAGTRENVADKTGTLNL